MIHKRKKMIDDSQPWVSRFKPCSLKELKGNEKAVKQLLDWVESWDEKIPKKRAAFLYGPPGVGKTSSVAVLANELNFDLLEVNASDHRTRKRLEELVGRSSMQRMTITGKRRMILFDELEGVSGRKDQGGITAIANIIKETRIPVILVATSIREKWEDKFRPLADLSIHIEFKPINFGELMERLIECSDELGISLDEEALEHMVELSKGDLRSAINDLESIARGKERITLNDVAVLSDRDRKDYIPDALMKMFSAKTLIEARSVISSTHIGYDDLFDWIYENLPFVLDSPRDLSEGMEALVKADIHQTRAKRTQNFRLLKYMFNEMTGGVALSRQESEGKNIRKMVEEKIASLNSTSKLLQICETPDGVEIKPTKYLGKNWRKVNTVIRGLGATWVKGGGRWILPYFRPPQRIWRYRRTWHSRRRLRAIAHKLADKCHTSTREAISEVIPLLKVIFKGNPSMGDAISDWIDLEEKEVEWMKS